MTQGTVASPLMEYIKVMRPDHWLKNVFIFFGHVVAVALLHLSVDGELLGRVVFSLVPACLVASANYIINEILDAPYDRVHPTKRLRAVAAGTVSIPVLWVICAGLCLMAFGMSVLFFNRGYTLALGLLLASGIVYNVPPVRLKDRAYLDVISESFNNPIRLWLGWFALVDPPGGAGPVRVLLSVPLSIIMAWWFFGALLMAGKRYAEYRFIGDAEQSGRYRRSFRVYDERRLIISMITYANFFCFCMGVAITVYRPNLLFVFPIIVLAIIVYFNHAMTTEGAKLEPEQLMRNPALIVCTLATVAAGLALTWLDVDLTAMANFLEMLGENQPADGP